jgi:hypothetical protein
MRLFTKLRAEQIATVAYPLPVVSSDNNPPLSTEPKPTQWPSGDKPKVAVPVPDWPNLPKVVITTIHNEKLEILVADLLLSPKVSERKDLLAIAGDWYVTDYDIQTDKVICKVYDNETFVQYFKASLGG